jgi:hypothetical protein
MKNYLDNDPSSVVSLAGKKNMSCHFCTFLILIIIPNQLLGVLGYVNIEKKSLWCVETSWKKLQRWQFLISVIVFHFDCQIIKRFF